MSTQHIFAQQPQTPFGFAEDAQPAIAFPLTLSEKYQPRKLDDIVGLEGPLRLLSNLAKAPRPSALLFVGKPGIGKTIAGLCFADTLGGSLVHISSQKCDVATLDSLRDRFAYHPPKGKFWVCLVDEADQMSEKAQVQFLSRLDATASLVVGMGGAATRQSSPPIIWIFTANGLGSKGTIPPPSLEKRFISRCMVIAFDPMDETTLGSYLRSYWTKDAAEIALPAPEYFAYLAAGGEVRESLMKMQVDILTGAPRPIPAETPACEPATAKPCQKPVILLPRAANKIPDSSAKLRRVYAGKADDRITKLAKHLAAHNVEPFVRDVKTSTNPNNPRASLLVRGEDFSRAMSLAAQFWAKA